MKNPCAHPSFLLRFCLGFFLLIPPMAAYGTKVNLPTLKEALTVLNIQESLHPTTFTLISNTTPSESVLFTVQVCSYPAARKRDLSLSDRLIARNTVRFKWKTWVIPRNCFVQGDAILHDPHKGKLLIRVIGRFRFPSYHPPTCRLIPEKNPSVWEFK